jgi:serine/threonine-protein kinase
MAASLSDEPVTFREGATLSKRYRIVRQIGQGAIGRVYEVVHVRVGRRFAAKVLKAEYRGSSQMRERFRREAKVGGKLRSPYAVEVVDYGESDGAPYLIMEYLDGETLQALVAREGSLPVRRAATLLVHACRGVRAAHAFGILHRDLKPSNLFVAADERGELCKVLDFGIAKATASKPVSSQGPETSTGAVMGTLQYMAPEQLRGQRDLDARVDVYALGSILYECLSGSRAFDAPTPSALMYRILEESPAPLATLRPELPPALVGCVERAMARDQEARTASVEELERQLLTFAAEQPGPLTGDATAVDTRADRPLTLRQRWRARTSRKLSLVAAVAALAVPLGALLGYRAGVNASPDGPGPPAEVLTARPVPAPAGGSDQRLNTERASSPPILLAEGAPKATIKGTPPAETSSAPQQPKNRVSDRRARAPEPAASAKEASESNGTPFDRHNPYRSAP